MVDLGFVLTLVVLRLLLHVGVLCSTAKLANQVAARPDSRAELQPGGATHQGLCLGWRSAKQPPQGVSGAA